MALDLLLIDKLNSTNDAYNLGFSSLLISLNFSTTIVYVNVSTWYSNLFVPF